LVVTAVCLLAAAAVLFLPGVSEDPTAIDATELDTTAVNRIVQSVAGQLQAGQAEPALPDDHLTSPYALVTPAGELIAQTAGSDYITMNYAIHNRSTIVDVPGDDGALLARLVFTNDTQALVDAALWRTRGIALAGIAACLLMVLVVLHTVERLFLKPFVNMAAAARHIAAGDLDTALAMDNANAMGPFTEAVDLLRSELQAARGREAAAEKGKKELVASLSHDIKTPLASIQATAELMQAQAAEQRQRDQLDVIIAKANQITSLTNDLFQTALEDLEQLAVTPCELPSPQLAAAITAADYQQRITRLDIPECLVRVDLLRFSQITDNILGNSYKYAATPIEVTAAIEDSMLVINFQDSGPGVAPESLPLLTSKYYRGTNSADKPGAGLGLYLAHYFATRMAGTLECQNITPGFRVTLTLPLA
jgi:signal transduction histidine kinase